MQNRPNDQMKRWVEGQSQWNEEIGESIAEANHEREAKEDRVHEDVLASLREVKQEQEQEQLRVYQEDQDRKSSFRGWAVLIVAGLTLIVTTLGLVIS